MNMRVIPVILKKKIQRIYLDLAPIPVKQFFTQKKMFRITFKIRLYYVTIPSVVNVNVNNLKQLDIHKLIMINTIILTMICPKKERDKKKFLLHPQKNTSIAYFGLSNEGSYEQQSSQQCNSSFHPKKDTLSHNCRQLHQALMVASVTNHCVKVKSNNFFIFIYFYSFSHL